MLSISFERRFREPVVLSRSHGDVIDKKSTGFFVGEPGIEPGSRPYRATTIPRIVGEHLCRGAEN